MMPLKYGLLRSYQTSLGVEIPLRAPLSSSPSRASSTTWTRRSSTCRSTMRRSSRARQQPACCPRRSSTPDEQRAGVHRSPDQAADRAAPTASRSCCAASRRPASSAGSRTRSRGPSACAPSCNGRVDQMVWRPYDFDRTAPLQPGRRDAAAPQLGHRRALAIPERRARRRDQRLQRRAHGTATCASTCASTSAPSTRSGCSISTSTSPTSRCCPRRSQPGTVIRYVLPTVGLRGRL